MNDLPLNQAEKIPPMSWADVYQQFGSELSSQDEADITDRLTSFFDLLNTWNIRQ